MQPTYTDTIRQQQQPQPPQVRLGGPSPDKIGGWLIVVAIGLIFASLRILLFTFKDIIPVFKPETWSLLTTPGTPAYHPLWAPLLIGELAGNLFFVVFGITIVVLFFQRRRIVPRLVIIYLLTNLGFVLTDYFVADLIPIVAQQDNTSAVKEIFRGVVGAGIWIPYFIMSKRVKSTFVR